MPAPFASAQKRDLKANNYKDYHLVANYLLLSSLQVKASLTEAMMQTHTSNSSQISGGSSNVIINDNRSPQGQQCSQDAEDDDTDAILRVDSMSSQDSSSNKCADSATGAATSLRGSCGDAAEQDDEEEEEERDIDDREGGEQEQEEEAGEAHEEDEEEEDYEPVCVSKSSSANTLARATYSTSGSNAGHPDKSSQSSNTTRSGFLVVDDSDSRSLNISNGGSVRQKVAVIKERLPVMDVGKGDFGMRHHRSATIEFETSRGSTQKSFMDHLADCQKINNSSKNLRKSMSCSTIEPTQLQGSGTHKFVDARAHQHHFMDLPYGHSE